MSLVELMVGMALALALCLAAIATVISARASFDDQDESTRVVETGLLATSMVERALRQAGYENWGAAAGAWEDLPGLSPPVSGLDDARLPDDKPALQSAASPGVNRSDVLALRFFGSGDAANGADGSMLNCAGVPVPEPAAGDAEGGRGWSIFHVARSASAEPELRCKYRSQSGEAWDSQPLVSGVESMQVLFGFDNDGDGRADRYLPANAVPAGEAGKALWRQVAAVRVSMLVRSALGFAAAGEDAVYDLFGADYSRRHAQHDPGARLLVSGLPDDERKRLRRVFSTTVALRNRPAQFPSAGAASP